MLGTNVCIESKQGCDNQIIILYYIPWEMSLYQSEVVALA